MSLVTIKNPGAHHEMLLLLPLLLLPIPNLQHGTPFT
jgi:hypothetical protein